MSRRSLSAFRLGLTGLAVAASALALFASTAMASTGWTQVAVPPSDPNTNGVLNNGSVLNDNDAWAVGTQFGVAGSTPPPPLSYHWNGTAWSRVAVPAVPNATSNALFAVNAASSTDAWAVGLFHLPFTGYHGGNSLFEHWDGSAWSVVSGANAGGLVGVADLGSTNAWAISASGLVEHWDGTAWTITTTPHPNPADTVGDRLVSLTVDSPTDIWALGTFAAVAGQSGLYTLHYDGTAWTVQYLPTPSVGTVLLGASAISASSASDVWATGSSDGGAYVEHFDGTTWQEVALPAGLFYPNLTAIAARSGSDVWASGASFTGPNSTTSAPLYLHWTGTGWTVGTAANEATALVTQPGTARFWGVGVTSGNQPLIQSHS